MFESIKIRAGCIGFLVFLSLLYLLPTIVPKDETGKPKLPSWWGTPLPKRKMNLGLALRGGRYLVYTVKFEDAIKEECDREIQAIKETTFKTQNINATELKTIEASHNAGGWGIR